MSSLLFWLSKHGPSVLAVGVLFGLAWPGLAAAARPLMPITVFVFVLGPMLRIDASLILAALKRLRISVALPLFVMVACPILCGLAAQMADLDPDLRLALVLAVSVPPSSGTAAVASTLNLDAAVPLVTTLVSMAMAPITVPLLGQWASATTDTGMIAIGFFDLAWRLASLIGGAALVAVALRRWAGRVLIDYALVLDAVVVISLLVFALATMAGVRGVIEASPGRAAGFIALAYGCNIGLQLLAGTLFPGPTATRITVGLTNGNRNVGLIWSVLGTAASPTIALYFATTQLPIYTLPRLTQGLLRRLRVNGRSQPTAPSLEIQGRALEEAQRASALQESGFHSEIEKGRL